MHRFFSDPDRICDKKAFLSAEDARHAITVLRLGIGCHIEIIHQGVRFEAEIISIDNYDVCVRFVSSLPSTETSLSVTLYQGIPKADKMDLIIQKATELGVTRIVPVLMNRCIVRFDSGDIRRKSERWQKIAREAGKQSGRCIIPPVMQPVELHRITQLSSFPEMNVVPWEEARDFGPLSFRKDYPSLSSLGILIGPEGGIEKQEIVFLQSAGFIPITLGKRILRTETAGLAAVSSFMSLYGEME